MTTRRIHRPHLLRRPSPPLTPPPSASHPPSVTARLSASAAPRVSLLTATCIVIANMVGTGIFTSLGFQVGDLPSGFAIIVLWMVGGVCAMCGALSYAELGAALPRSGGEYNFLREIYHPSLGFLAGWVSATVGFSAPVAIAAMPFGTYLAQLIPGTNPAPLGLGRRLDYHAGFALRSSPGERVSDRLHPSQGGVDRRHHRGRFPGCAARSRSRFCPSQATPH